MAVVLNVRLGRFRRVMRSMLQVPVCGMRVMRRRQMIVGLVMFRSFAMMPGRVLVVLRRFVVMLHCLFGQEALLGLGFGLRGAKVTGFCECRVTAGLRLLTVRRGPSRRTIRGWRLRCRKI